MKNTTHEQARIIVEFWLIAKGKQVVSHNTFAFPPEFCQRHRLGTKWRPNTKHSFDIYCTQPEGNDWLIEIDDYGKHSTKSQRINDGIINDFAQTILAPKHYELFRLQKEEIVDTRGRLQATAAKYLQDNLS